MKCSLIQELRDAREIINQFSSLEDVISWSGHSPYYVKDWFKDRPDLLKTLNLRHFSYQNVNRRLNQIMADLF